MAADNLSRSKGKFYELCIDQSFIQKHTHMKEEVTRMKIFLMMSKTYSLLLEENDYNGSCMESRWAVS